MSGSAQVPGGFTVGCELFRPELRTMATVVFADLVGSTGLFERLGDEAASRFVTQLMGELGARFARHQGRVVKLLGDGLFVVFDSEANAVAACIDIQNHLFAQPIRPTPQSSPIQMQMGLESGEVVEIEGDCFGDTVNSAARLADLAGAAQILTTERVWAVLFAAQRACLRSMGPMYLRGKAQASHVYRVEWLAGRDEDSTMAGRSMVQPPARGTATLELRWGGECVVLEQGRALSIGRLPELDLTVHDPRVSRVHAAIAWRSGHFLLSDSSSFGTWVYLGIQAEPVVLRRTECYLVGQGQICLGCERDEPEAPLIEFALRGSPG